MKTQDYIQSKLYELKQPLGKTVPKSKEELVAEIIRLTLSKKFRKYALKPEIQEHIKNAVKMNVEKNEPIKFTLPFGGYKLWRLGETPEADWAELFAMMYYTKWVKPICEIYEPGVWFDFFSDDIVVKRLNNIPVESTEAYGESFKNLLQFIKPYQPKNLDMTFTRVGDRYTSIEEFDEELDKNIKATRAEFDGEPPTINEAQKATIELNVKTTKEQENDPMWREKVFLLHEAYGKASKRRPYYRIPEKIMVVATPLWGMLCVGTTKDSVAKFWCGAGALKPSGDEYRQLVLSPSQLQKTDYSFEEISLSGPSSKNFSKIRIVRN